MIGDLPIQSRVAASRVMAPERRARRTSARLSPWQRRVLEGLVAIASFAIWGKLAYIGTFRLLARWEGLGVRGPMVLDVLSLVIGVAGSIAGASALWAVSMRLLGRTPSSLIGAPDDSPEDWPSARRAGVQPGATTPRRRATD
jgi:hypothetical protein